MKYNADQHHRRSIRLKGHDYSEPGSYFITICAYQQSHLFGAIVEGGMQSNGYGAIAANCWHQIPQHFPHVALNEFVVMPNHIHGIIVIIRRDMALPCPPPDDRANHPGLFKCAQCDRPVQTDNGEEDEEDTAVPCPYGCANSPKLSECDRRFGTAIPGSIPTIVGSFKSAATKQINLVRNAPGTPVWQGNYYEHIIRDERSLTNIQNYIVNNPRSWVNDRFRQS